MAERSVFISKSTFPFFEEVHVSLDWFGGFALSQKRKCQIGLHQNFLRQYPDRKILEISSASLMSLGAKLSAMNLSKRTGLECTCVESAFQSSRIYSDGEKVIGPFPEYLFLPGKMSKKLVKEASEGMHSYEYSFDGMHFRAPAHHISQFYDFLYINALLEPENRAVAEALLAEGYTAFSDLATKSLNCQARAAAMFVGLVQAGLIDKVRDQATYLALFRTDAEGRPIGPTSYEGVQLMKNGKIQLHSPVVSRTFDREAVEAYYRTHCSMLTNQNTRDNFLDLQNHAGQEVPGCENQSEHMEACA